MAKQDQNSSFQAELFKAGLYKRNQGRLARQLTAVAVALVTAFGCYSLSQQVLEVYNPLVTFGVPLLIWLLTVWVAYRLVNYPRFADFLISVEAEMDKVSWASKPELFRATVVVLSTMVIVGAVLFAYDMIWVQVFTRIGILLHPEAQETPVEPPGGF